MNKNILKKAAAIFSLAFVFAPMLAVNAASQAITGADELFGKRDGNEMSAGATNEALGSLTEEDPRVVVARVINVLLGFLGIIAVIIVLMGGFKWMTSQGDEKKIEEARKLIIAGIMGLAIILSAFAIAQFAVGTLFEAMSGD